MKTTSTSPNLAVMLLAATALALSAMLALSGCDPTRTDDDTGTTTQPGDGNVSPRVVKTGPLEIAVIPKATNHEFWKAVHAGAVKAQHELPGVRITWQGPAREDDRNAQITVVESVINKGVDGIVLAPLDSKALVRPVREAMREGIPVVIMDSGLEAEPGSGYVSFIATDNTEAGRNAARRLGYAMGGKGRLLPLRYLEGSASTTNREEGFLSELAQRFPGIEVLTTNQYAGATSAEAQDKAETLLLKYPEIDGIFCPCEPPVLGMLNALQQADRLGKVKFVGFDTSDKLVEALSAGHLHGLVLQDPMQIGYRAVQTLVTYLRGTTVATRIDTGSVVATPDNMFNPDIHERLHPPIDEYLAE